MTTDGNSIRASGDNISDGRLDRQGANTAQVTYSVFCCLLQKRKAIIHGFDRFILSVK